MDQGTKRHRTNFENKETTANLREKRETEEKTEIVYKKNQEQKWHWTKQQPWQLKDTVEKKAFKMLRGKLFSN